MRPVVVDPRLLVQALQHPYSPAARLLALLAYGSACAEAAGYAGGEVDALEDLGDEEGAPVGEDRSEELRAAAEERFRRAAGCRSRMESALPPDPPQDIVLVTSLALVERAADLAQVAQAQGHRHLHPEFVRRQVVLPALRIVAELGAAARGLPAVARGTLVGTAVEAGAGWVITEDKALLGLAGTVRHAGGARVVVLSLPAFVREQVGDAFDFWSFDPRAVMRAFAGC